ncbi:MAG: MGMT family protein [Flavobacteriales bacterium]|jgi:methylated-DNA-protein-cysteine methyltransferase-like protein|nr:MGMT family protein [Flavobacteriales bacterium]
MSENKRSFFEDAKAVARLIPKGRVCSYGSIAKYLGAERSARMVGWAMNSIKPEENIPAHRVVNRKGLLTGKKHFNGKHTMQELLEAEGITIIDHQIQNLATVFWDPSIELL